MLVMSQLHGFNAMAPFIPFAAEYTTPGTQTVPIPYGAETVTIEGIASGGSAASGTGARVSGGGGGQYAKKNTYPVAGLTGIYIIVPDVVAGASGNNVGTAGADAVAKENSSGGTDIIRAKAGAAGARSVGGTATSLGGSAGGVGDVLNDGGDSVASGSNRRNGGGGAGGPSSAGGDVSNSLIGGTSGGSPAGAGGTGLDTGDGLDGNNYGAGGGSGDATGGDGAQGWIKLTWA